MPTRRKLTKDEQTWRERQKVTSRCADCGDLLGENVTLKQSIQLIARHRREAHPSDQQAGNRRAREGSERRVLAAFDGTWMPVRKVCANAGMQDVTVRKVLSRLVAQGRVEEQRVAGGVRIFRRK